MYNVRRYRPAVGRELGFGPPVRPGLRTEELPAGQRASAQAQAPQPPASNPEASIRRELDLSRDRMESMVTHLRTNPPRVIVITERGERQVNGTSRPRDSADYYANSVFTFNDLGVLLRWYSSVPAQWRNAVNDMRVVDLRVPNIPWSTEYFAWADAVLVAARPRIERVEAAVGRFATKIAYEIECVGCPLRAILRMPASDALRPLPAEWWPIDPQAPPGMYRFRSWNR